ncbi:PTS lactose/cellobiose transporter subunit IIA [Bacillus oleivorans]|nr:PTS lactose/cellobiose transporter subunit IIA [Bacillus oleivorans]
METAEQLAFQLILHSGNGRSLAMEALLLAKEKKWDEAEQKLEEANQELIEAHSIQAGLLTNEAKGEKVSISLLFIHAQDHLMNAITVKELCEEILQLWKHLGEVSSS